MKNEDRLRVERVLVANCEIMTTDAPNSRRAAQAMLGQFRHTHVVPRTVAQPSRDARVAAWIVATSVLAGLEFDTPETEPWEWAWLQTRLSTAVTIRHITVEGEYCITGRFGVLWHTIRLPSDASWPLVEAVYTTIRHDLVTSVFDQIA